MCGRVHESVKKVEEEKTDEIEGDDEGRIDLPVRPDYEAMPDDDMESQHTQVGFDSNGIQ